MLEFLDVNLGNEDISRFVFQKLFGTNWWDAVGRGDVVTGPLIPILQALNFMMLEFIAIYGLYIVVVSGVSTASEGRIGGKDKNMTWWTLRMGLGLGVTAPLVKGGLSVFQITILALVGGACSFANDVFEMSLDEISNSNMVMLTSEAPPHVREEGKKLAELIYIATAAQVKAGQESIALANELKKHGSSNTVKPWTNFSPVAVNSYFPIKEGEDNGNWVIKFAVPPDRGLAPEDLGVIAIPGIPEDPMMLAKKNGIIAMHRIISPVARSAISDQKVQEGWLRQAVDAYENEVVQVYSNFAQHYPELEVTQKTQALKERARALGWMSAGAWPLYISSLSAEAGELKLATVSISSPNIGRLQYGLNEQRYNEWSRAMTTANSLLKKEPDPNRIGTSIKESMMTGDFGGAFNTLMYHISGRSMLSTFLERLKNEGPVLAVPQLGHLIMDAGNVLFMTGLGLVTFSDSIKGWKDSFVGQVAGAVTGGTLNATVSGAVGAVSYIVVWMQVLASGLYCLGIIFAFVFPLVSVLFWIVAMVNFMMLIVEVMVAAPFWTAAHAWGTKESGFVGEMGKKGYFQFLEILFRPVLYVLGFLVIVLVMKSAGWLVSTLFEAYYYSYAHSNVSGDFSFGHTGLLSSLVMCMVLGSLQVYIYYLLCTEGYSHLPQRVMQWIGHQTDTMGMASQADSMRQTVVGAIRQATHSRRSPGIIPVGGASGGSKEMENEKNNPHSPGSVPNSGYGKGVVGSNLKKPKK